MKLGENSPQCPQVGNYRSKMAPEWINMAVEIFENVQINQ